MIKIVDEPKEDNELSITTDEQRKREGKLFSLFALVQFKNSPCNSNSLGRRGTCFTSGECSSRRGTASGSCGAGFGVCCVFVISAAGASSSQNCTYIQNPNYPSNYGSTTSVSYTIRKCAANVCKLRLDFESFTLVGTGNTIENELDAANAPIPGVAGQCKDTFDVTTNTNQRIPTICGENTGQHMYVDVGLQASDSINLDFTFDNNAFASNNRKWAIKVTQLPCYGECSAKYMPPMGCLQYHTGITGTLKTFNFDDENDNHLPNQDYSICVRQEKGYCCVMYMPCANTDNAFSIQATMADPTAQVAGIDSDCTLDYIGIGGSQGKCEKGKAAPVVNKYCLQKFNANTLLMVDDQVCDCTQPWIVDVFTDNLDDAGDMAAAVPNPAQSRGVCLDYKQIKC